MNHHIVGTGLIAVIGEYDAAKAKPIVVWEDLEGNRHAVTGGKRLAMAGASGAESVRAVVIKESDGWTEGEARSLGATENLKEGSGGLRNVVEAVENGMIGADGVAELAGWNQAKGSAETAAKIRRGLAVAQKGGAELKAALENGTISDSFAYNAAQVLSAERVGEGWEAAQRELMGLVGKVGPEELEAVLWGLKRRLGTDGGSGAPEPLPKDGSTIDWGAAIAEERARYNAKKGGAEGKLDSDQVLIETADGELKTLGEMEAENFAASGEAQDTASGEVEAPELAAAQGAGANRAVELRPIQGRDGAFGTLSHPKARFTVDGERKVVAVDGLTAEDFAPGRAEQTAALVARVEAYARESGLRISFPDEATRDAWARMRENIKAEGKEAYSRAQMEAKRGAVVERLTKSGLATEVVQTKGDFDRLVVELNGRPLTAGEEVYGFCDVSTGKVYLNPDFFATRQGLDAPLHEFGHLGIIATEKVNKVVYDRGMRLAGELLERTGGKPPEPPSKVESTGKGAPPNPEQGGATGKGGVAEIVDFILNDAYYSKRSRQEQAEELLAQLIGRRGEEALRSETNKTVVNKIKAWLVEFWNTFGKALGLKDITPEQAAKMTIEEVADAIRAEMLSGRRYGEGFDRVEFGLAEGTSAIRIATKPVRIRRKLTGRRKAVNEFVRRLGGGDDPANRETDLLALWVDSGGRLFDKMPFEVETHYSKGATGVKRTRWSVADEFAESTAFYRGLDAAQRKVFFGTGKLEAGSIGEGLRQRLEDAGITRFTNGDGTVDFEAVIGEFQRQWTNYERGEEFLKERNEWQEERDRAMVEEMERAEKAAYDEMSAEEAAGRAEMEAAEAAQEAQIAADMAAGRWSRRLIGGQETAVSEGYPLSIREARDPDKVLKVLSPLVGKSAAQIGEMKLTRISEASVKHLINSEHARQDIRAGGRDRKKLWRGSVAGMSVTDDIVATSSIGTAQAAKHLNADWKKGATFYEAKTRFAVEVENGKYEVYPCKLIVSEINGERQVYDLTEIGTPTPTTSVSPKTATVGGPQRGLTANGGVGALKEPTLSASAGKANLALPQGRTGESASSPRSIPQTDAGAQGGGLKPAAPRSARWSRSGIFTGTAGNAAASGRAQDRGSVGPSALGDGKQRYYEVPFDKAVDKIVANKKPVSKEHVFVSETPKPFADIGFARLPVMMGQGHVLSCYFGEGEGVEGKHLHKMKGNLKLLPQALEKPLMIITSESSPSDSVVAILKMKDNTGASVIVPVKMSGVGRAGGTQIDAHIALTMFGKKNAWKKLVADAIEKEANGEVGVFYIDGAESKTILERLGEKAKGLGVAGLQSPRETKAHRNPENGRSGLQSPSRSILQGTVHSIADEGSPVKGGIVSQTATRQFKRWFGGSQVVDENGEPLVVYHGTEKTFWSFSNQQIGSHTDAGHEGGVGLWGRGHYFTSDRSEAEGYARGNPDGRTMAVYLNIRNPMGREELVRIGEEAARITEDRPEDFYREYQRLIDESVQKNGYDGAIVNNKHSTEYVVFEPSQIKSATDNIGTFDAGNADIRFSRAVGALTGGKKNATLRDVDQKRLTAVIRGLGSGELKHPRFTREEAAASQGAEHEQLWNYILSLESSDVDGGGTQAVERGQREADSQGGGRLGRLRRVATRYGSDPREIAGKEHKYFDRGAESHVYDRGDGTVIKVRRLDAYDMDGVKHALAKIVYHNRLFPKDAYKLQDIAVWKNANGFDEYYMILEQPLVTPKRDADGNIIAPSQGHIIQALRKTGQKFNMTGGYYDNGETPRGSSGSGETVESAKMVAASGDYAVYDFKPGRNTFLDAETGEVRFIDPRIDINDPTDSFAYSKFGKRRRTDVGFDVDRQETGRRPAEREDTPWTAEDEARFREQEEANAVLDDMDFEGSPSREGEGARWSRGGSGLKPAAPIEAELVVTTRVADDAGVGERTPGAIAASRELSRQGAVPLTTKGTRYVSLPLSEMNALARYLTGHALPGELAEHSSAIKSAGKASIKHRKLVIAADVLGTIDKSDMAVEKEFLKQHGFTAAVYHVSVPDGNHPRKLSKARARLARSAGMCVRL